MRLRSCTLRRAGLNALGVLVALVTLFPILWMVSTAFKPAREIYSLTPRPLPSGHMKMQVELKKEQAAQSTFGWMYAHALSAGCGPFQQVCVTYAPGMFVHELYGHTKGGTAMVSVRTFGGGLGAGGEWLGSQGIEETLYGSPTAPNPAGTPKVDIVRGQTGQGASAGAVESTTGTNPAAATPWEGEVIAGEGLPTAAYTDESGESSPLACTKDRCYPTQVTMSTDEIINAYCGGEPVCIMAQSGDWAGAEKRIHDFALGQVTDFAMALGLGAVGAAIAKVAGPMRLEFQIFRGEELIRKGVMWSGRGGHAEMKFLAKYGRILMEGDQVILQGGNAICRYGACRSSLNAAAKAGADILYYGYTPHMSLTYFEGGVGWIKAPRIR